MIADPARLLERGFTEAVRDPLWGHIFLTPALARLTATPAFRKLERIQQLGPTAYIYPGATHSRAAHSLGVYHLARRLLRSLLDRGAGEWTTASGAASFLAAALLHDLGHFPYAHSLKELPLEDHETLTGRLMLAEPLKSLIADADADPYLAAAIVDKRLPVGACQEAVFYRRLLSGVLDPDKLDYLNRDARYCGVPYGAQDVDFIYSRLFPHPERGVDIDNRGVASIEAVLFAKYLMYRSVYWHRDVRASTAMVKKAVKNAIDGGRLAPEALYGLDDAGLFGLIAEGGGVSADLASAVRYGQPFACVWETPFDPDRPAHRSIENLDDRFALENDISTELRSSPTLLIIDLPEPISFETGLFIRDENRFFEESATVFAPPTLRSFTRNLRVIRAFLAPAQTEHASTLLPILRRYFL